MGRKCCVPNCYTGYASCKEKASMFRVPEDDFFLNRWQDAVAREDRPITPKDYVCEKHFKPEDLIRHRFVHNAVEYYKVPRLKQDAVPSVFPALPEFIKKMVKKRRKLPIVEIKPEPPSEVLEVQTIETEIHIKTELEEAVDEPVNNRGPKIHQCPDCDYSTKYSGNLKMHLTKHQTGDEVYYRCELCPKFKSKWQLTYKNHLKIRHGIGPQIVYKCSLCVFQTKVRICLKRHMMRHERVFQEI